MVQDLHVQVTGSGLPVVLLHAFPFSSQMWRAQHAEWGTDWRLITPDLRGFGDSPLGDDAPDLDRMADDVAALLDRQGLETVVLGGLSMGGYVTMAFLRRHPGRARALILADTKAGADAEPARANRIRIAAAVLQEKSPRILLEQMLPALVGRTSAKRRPELVSWLRDLVAAADPAALAWAQRAMAVRSDSFQLLRDFDSPVLVMVGEEDTLTPLAEAETMIELLPHGRLIRIPAAGHLAAAEAPGPFNQALREFLAAL
jgi:pimeloyl-ACP methyl ester carboxylesterase